MLAQPVSRLIFGIVPWYSFLIVCGIIIAFFLAQKEERRLNLPQDTVLDLILRMLPIAILGARIYYVLFTWSEYQQNPLRIFFIWEGGLAIYGGIIAGLIVVLLFCKKRKLSVLVLCDIIVPGLAIAQGIGRWGNYFNMEAYGLSITDPAWMFFPAGVLINENGQQVWHMATFFYESCLDVFIGLFLLLYRKKSTHRKNGDVFLWYILLYGAARIMTEHFRTDSLFSLGGSFRVSQLLSVFMCLSVIIVYAWQMISNITKKRNMLQPIVIILMAIVISVVLIVIPSFGFAEPFIGFGVSFCILLFLSSIVFFCACSNRKQWITAFISFMITIFAVLMNRHLSYTDNHGIMWNVLSLLTFVIPSVSTTVVLYNYVRRNE